MPLAPTVPQLPDTVLELPIFGKLPPVISGLDNVAAYADDAIAKIPQAATIAFKVFFITKYSFHRARGTA